MNRNYLYIDPWSAQYITSPKKRPPIYICLSGNSGAGKSTLLKNISSNIYQKDSDTIAIDEKAVHHNLLQYLFDKTEKYGYLLQLNFMIQRSLLIKSWLDKGFNLIMERSHIEDYIFISFMYKSKYITKEQYDTYMTLWNEINKITPTPDIIIFLDFSVDHSLQNIKNDELKGIRPREFPNPELKEKWITGWFDEYQGFTQNLPRELKENVIIYNKKKTIDELLSEVINKITGIRNMK
ncbi:deoxynucleoside kinase [Edwardsiella ictaluri]|uniref:deoxynucleoside kinase n=1 Tax=Edwardsiella ictaluri TaxID=67780 RepID=UPI000558D13C|nr:deoxynucleoside kinase [Edwardsiella ictaluri]AVZ82715.1 deoxynucleoside kinase [Edwardsiella ictaluri]EKS7764874.1 deoxynucleoside kinase [Edwardsiella ictaluri]EKS7771778.1 deoxynucleoside kinase [Edwardsiella ictaluri]EKS7774968.1 deoxynucleoside kinase [Edwardsiella ictaluri]EKS7778201.1 deoxynucleoside kinase [Edwardsiella ictaluri]